MFPLIAAIGASLIGGVISSNASKSAAKTVQQGTDAATAEQRRQFDQTLALAMPGYNRANAAGDLYSRALGIGRPQRVAPEAQSFAASPSMTGSGYSAPAYAGRQDGSYARMMALVDSGQLQGDPPAGLMTGSYTNGQSTVPAPQQVGEGMEGDQLDIAQQVMQTPGYQTQLDQGLKAIDRAAPLVGGMYSGRRMKALEAQGQNTFGSYYERWMDRVGGVAGQERGITSDISQAGQNNANNVGQLLMTGANARANGALNSASAWTGALGTAAGMAGGYYR